MSEEPGGPKKQRARSQRWAKRPSIRSLRREAGQRHDVFDDWDVRANDASRLPPAETVSLGGLVLAEAFTPSTVSRLYRALRTLPVERPRDRADWIATLTERRG